MVISPPGARRAEKISCPGPWWCGNLQRSGPMLIG